MADHSDPCREALADLLSASQSRPSCQAGAVERCRCLVCASRRARAALAQPPAPERGALQALIEAEFDRFFEFPTDDRSQVSSVSCRLFAEHVVRLTAPPAAQGAQADEVKMLRARLNSWLTRGRDLMLHDPEMAEHLAAAADDSGP